MTKIINRFVGEYRWLSNFHIGTIVYDGEEYPTAEHAYQAAKTTDKKEKKEIRLAKTPKLARQLGQKVKLIKNWDNKRYEIMNEILHIKFQNEELKKMLLETEDAVLIEENTWHDIFFGVCDGVGENNLGKILMNIRKELKNG